MSTTAAPAVPPPAVGTPAPDFTLASTSGEKVTLSSFRGRQPVLLAFFPLAFTSTCTAELCGFSDDYDAFGAAGVQVLPISVDAVPSLREFKQKYGLKTDLLSDFRRDASRLYGVLNEERYYSNRSYFLIDRDGIVRWSHVEGNNSERRDNAEVLAQIAKL
jgi:peroxiredoxin